MNRDDTKHRRGGEGRGGRVGEEEEGEARMREGTEEGGRVCSVVRLRSSWRDRWAHGSN